MLKLKEIKKTYVAGDSLVHALKGVSLEFRESEFVAILGHSGCGNVGRAQCEELAQDPRYDNVYFEICGSFLSQRKWSESLKVIDYHRVLYGTDAPIHSIVFELARLLSEDIPDEQMRAILGGNTKRIFGFE